MQDRPISWEEHQIPAPIIPPQIETLPTHLRHENCGQRSLSLEIHLWCESTTFTADYDDCLLWKYSFDKRSYDWLFGQRENIVWAECALRQPFWQIIKPHAFWSRLPSYSYLISIGSRNSVLADDNDQHAQVWQLLTFLLFVATWVDILARVSTPILSLTSITALLLTLRLKSQNYQLDLNPSCSFIWLESQSWDWNIWGGRSKHQNQKWDKLTPHLPSIHHTLFLSLQRMNEIPR